MIKTKSKIIISIAALVIVIFAAKAINDVVKNRLYKNDLIKGVVSDDFEKVKQLVNKGANVNTRDDKSGYTVLILAAKNHDFDMVKFLVEKGANVNATATGYLAGDTALRMASANGDIDIVKFLFENGADVNACLNNKLSTPLMDASAFGHLVVVRFLIDNGADVNAVGTDNFGEFIALALASEYKHPDVVKYLLEHGADPKFQNSDREKAIKAIIEKDDKARNGNNKGRGL